LANNGFTICLIKNLLLKDYMELIAKNELKLLGTFSGITVYDSYNAINEFRKHYSQMNRAELFSIIQSGIDMILLNLVSFAQYMIISKSNNLWIPIEIWQEQHTSEIIGIIPTIISGIEIMKIQNGVELFAEHNKNSYQRFPIKEGFNVFVQSGKIYSDFDEIVVD